MVKYLVQDIETIPETECAADWEKEREKLIAKGNPEPFPPIQVHKVITIGMLTLDADFLPVKSGCAAGGCAGGKSEKEMIERWSEVVGNGGSHPLRMVDWYGRGFDVPVLQTRAFRYGIPLPWYFGLQPDSRGERSQWSKEYRDRYAGAHDDLAEVWTNRGAFGRPHMANLAQLMGLPGKVGIDGSKVYETWKSIKDEHLHGQKSAERIDTYCMQDVFQTAFIFQRYQYMAGRIQIATYRTAAKALLDFVKKTDQELYSKIDTRAVLLESV